MSGVDCPLRRVFTLRRPFDRYRPYTTPTQLAELRERARNLRGRKIIDLSLSPEAGSAASMLHSLQPAFQGLGLNAHWYSLCPDPSFFVVARKLHDALLGGLNRLTEADRKLYQQINDAAAREVDRLDAEILVVHDVELAGVASALANRPRALIWRSHGDLSEPGPEALGFVEPLLKSYTLLVLETPACRLPSIARGRQRFVAGAIDPLALKNQIISRDAARQRLTRLGIAADRPLMCQVARFDPWKNPLGVVDAYRRARADVPGLQLALVGAIATTEANVAEQTFEQVKSAVGDDPNVFLFGEVGAVTPTVNQLDVDAFQSGADVAVLLACREGWGAALTEAMWKYRPVVATDRPGPRAQIQDGKNGFLVDGADAGAERVVQLLRDPALAESLGQHAHETVKECFLLPRLVDDYLGLFEEALAERAKRVA
ncbi:MAG TPA: glycosyltransferase [Chloroflexota bacterium]|nr:glycosyltransferase [Chloroflexota bacterium]